jgi:fido (protein-threonine AMPylation protein)
MTEHDGLPEATRGQLRAVQVWVGPPGSSQEAASFVPVPPEKLVARVRELLDCWRGVHSHLLHAPRSETISALAKFHHGFLQIHPFLDANGRLARVILDQAARELLGQSITAEFTADPAVYFAALRAADAGDLAPLEARISAALQ